MLFACVDNKVAELDRAEAAVVARGYTCKRIEATGLLVDWVRQIEEADVILTDLFFNPAHPESRNHPKYAASEPPAGLLVVIHALIKGKVIVVCTDESEKGGGHHGEGLSWIYDCFMSSKAVDDVSGSALQRPRLRGVRLGWNDRKDWTKAVTIAEAIVEAQKQQASPTES